MFDSKESKTFGYHLFFLPEGELFDNLQRTINELADKYNGPKFEPHVTLLSGIPNAPEAELVEKTRNLAVSMKPFNIELTKTETQDTFFRALYLKAIDTLTYQRYHHQALGVFEMKKQMTIPMPHLSLYYGNVPQSIKDEMIASLKLPVSMKFPVYKVYLYQTEGEVKNWVRIGEYIMGK